jgi:hypothetical protein
MVILIAILQPTDNSDGFLDVRWLDMDRLETPL